VVDFGLGGNAGEFRRTGWTAPEPKHTWTSGVESTLELPQPRVAGRYLMVLELGPFVWKDKLPVQRLTVLVNDDVVGEFRIRGVTAVECVVPWQLLADHDRVIVSFRHPDAAKPSEISGVADDRELALAFETVSFFRQATSPKRRTGRRNASDGLST